MTNWYRLPSFLATALLAASSPSAAQNYRGSPAANASLSGALRAATAVPTLSVSGATVMDALAPIAPSLSPSAVTPALAAVAVTASSARGLAPKATGPAAEAVNALSGPARARAEELLTAFDLKPDETLPAADGGALAPAPLKPEKPPVEPPTAAPTLKPGTPRSTQGALEVTDKNGVRHPLGYNPEIPYKSLWRETWDWIVGFPSKAAGVRRYMNRTQELVNAINDEDLSWSLNRFDVLQNQEGILRLGNRELVNDWKRWSGMNLMKVMPDDFADASVSRISIRKIFKQAMDREEPTRAYQWTSAMNLHNYLPRVAHFMGVTFQERAIAVALRGEAPVRSVWAAEEERHGNILERVYDFSREPGQPKLVEQGIAPTSPKAGRYSASSMMANRSLAEIGAGTGYLFLKGNARPGSPADRALEGIFRDEVYHYALMNAARKWGMGLRSRWAQLGHVLFHQLDNPLPTAVDAVIDERGGFSPLTIFEIAYAFWQIDKRVSRYLETIPDSEGKRLVGMAYRGEAEVKAAVARGEHTWTEPFPVEVNPEMSGEDVRELIRRFPGRFDASRRVLRASQIRGILTRYRASLAEPSYWLRAKGYQVVSDPSADVLRLAREAGEGDKRVLFHLLFPKDGFPANYIVIRVGPADRERIVFTSKLEDVSLRQFGAIFGAEDASALADFAALATDYTATEIAGRLLKTPGYQKDPIPVIED